MSAAFEAADKLSSENRVVTAGDDCVCTSALKRAGLSPGRGLVKDTHIVGERATSLFARTRLRVRARVGIPVERAARDRRAFLRRYVGIRAGRNQYARHGFLSGFN